MRDRDRRGQAGLFSDAGKLKQETLDLAGLTNDDGELERDPGIPFAWYAMQYQMEVRKRTLFYSEDETQRNANNKGRMLVRSPKPGMLLDFLNLADEVPDEDFLRYAKTWGPLELCAAGFPERFQLCGVCAFPDGHPPFCMAIPLFGPLKSRHVVRSESLDVWQWYAKAARSVLNVAIALEMDDRIAVSDVLYLDRFYQAVTMRRRGEFPPPTDEDIEREGKSFNDIGPNGRRSRAEAALSLAINRWLEHLGVRLHFRWKQDYRFVCRSVLGGIGILLAEALSGASIPVRCSACGSYFFPQRKRSPDKNAYCDQVDCQRAKKRINKRAERARKGHADASAPERLDRSPEG